MQPYKIIISKVAKKELFELFTYISENDYAGKAEAFGKKLLKKINVLLYFPDWHQHVQETIKVNSSHLYKIYCASYRIIYDIKDNMVTIRSIIDGRRDLKNLLPKKFSESSRELH